MLGDHSTWPRRRYGVREHAMGAIMVGLAAYGPNLVIPAAGSSFPSLFYRRASLLKETCRCFVPHFRNLLKLCILRCRSHSIGCSLSSSVSSPLADAMEVGIETSDVPPFHLTVLFGSPPTILSDWERTDVSLSNAFIPSRC